MVMLPVHVFHFTVSYLIFFDSVELASFKSEETEMFLNQYQDADSNNTNGYNFNFESFEKDEGTISTVRYDPNSNTTHIMAATTTTTATTTQIISTTVDPNSDLEDQITQVSTPSNGQPETASIPTPTSNKGPNDGLVNKSKPSVEPQTSYKPQNSVELNVLFFSIFVVYVSFVKLIYHNIAFIKHNMTEPGILMIFGILWELVSRQIITSYDAFPRFNSRIFFYLFLPSTVLESGSLLSNKWLFLNLFPILVHSIFGTILYASFLGFTIYYLSRQSLFNLSPQIQQQISPTIPTTSASTIPQKAPIYHSLPFNYSNELHLSDPLKKEFKAVEIWEANEPVLYTLYDKSYLTSGSSHELNNLTLADCLIFGTILSSFDATTMLSIFSSLQVNEKLYYLVLGESLMNNAVVLVIINLLLDFFNATRLTVVKIYIAIIQFFITIIGSIFVGLILASIALASVRLTKRFQISRAMTSYQNQCQAMVETLLILKLAYLTYTLANLVGTSSIVSLATFGILQDQYIKHNLNLRSQLAYRQVILATRTMGFSLVYPLLGMLLVEVASTSQVFQTWPSLDTSNNPLNLSQNNQSRTIKASAEFNSASVVSKLTHLAYQANLYWNFKFLSLVILITVVYRFVLVIGLTQVCNLFASSQLKIKFREQILVAFGGLKGPLAFAIVHKLIESEEYRDRTIKNKHLFIYTILFITFISTLMKGSCIRPLVVKMKLTLCLSPPSLSSYSTIVFDEINCKVTEHISSGLNSLLGHTKSPYDKFVELNETHIKPWLTRDGSNTNWLSVFYDTLILDETLNANCFYRSLEGSPMMRTHWSSIESGTILPSRSKIDSYRGSRDGNHDGYELKGGEKLWKTCSLDTIEEDGMLARGQDVQMKSKNMRQISSRRRSSSTSIKQKNSAGENIVADDNARTLLKEFVMFNLKLEDAKTRRRSAGFSSRVTPSNGFETHLKTRKLCPTRMISSTSSGEMAQETSSFELAQAAKHVLINQLEEKLSQSKKSGNKEATSGSALGTQLRQVEGVVLTKEKNYKRKTSRLESRGKLLAAGHSSTDIAQQQINERRKGRTKIHSRNRPHQARLHKTSD